MRSVGQPQRIERIAVIGLACRREQRRVLPARAGRGRASVGEHDDVPAERLEHEEVPRVLPRCAAVPRVPLKYLAYYRGGRQYPEYPMSRTVLRAHQNYLAGYCGAQPATQPVPLRCKEHCLYYEYARELVGGSTSSTTRELVGGSTT